ncbi:MAG: LamG domain-containing protein, partial [Bacteroidetes bacterium]
FNSGYGIYRMTGTNPILKSNCFYSDTAGSYYNISSGQGDFSSNPNFISYELNDFHLSNSSSCKDRGNNSLLLTWTLYDLDGNSRIYNAVVDVGAFEYRNINTNYSLQFDGNSDYVEIPDADVLSPSNFTIELWLKQPVVSSGRRNFYVAKANTSTQEYDFVDQSLIAGEEGLYAFVGNTYFMTTSHPVSNQWTHIAVTFNTALNKIEIFNNGISLGTDTTTQEVVNTNLNLFFGWVPGQPTYNGFIGLIDQIRISSIVRYTSSFNVSYSNFPNDASTVGLWYFNEGTGLTVYDQSGNNNHGTIHGATWSTDVPNYQTDTTTTWRMQIKAQIGSTTDLENFAGVADSATEGFDSNFDSPEPPNAPGNYITAYFNHPEWNPTLGSRFAKDIKKNTALADTVKRWFFDVETNVINDTVTLTFVNDRIPSSFGKYLTDLSNGKRINLKTTSVYKYYNTSTVSKKFMLIIGDSTTPQVSMLKPNGSEIFRSGTTKNITWQSSDGIG